MPKPPQITGNQLISILERVGFTQTRQKGSHVQVRRVEDDGKITTFPVPVHKGKTIKRGTLFGILRKANIDPQDLSELM